MRAAHLLRSESSDIPHAPTSGAREIGVHIGSLLLGKYRVERVLGVGGMGVVLRARHVELDQLVAIKVLLPAMIEAADGVRRFKREARAAARIADEHVVRVQDVGALEDGTPYMVMEHLHGADLAQVLEERGALPVHTAAEVMAQVCEALAAAHAAGVVHRDLKPANIFLARAPDGSTLVKVLDFGVSKMMAEEPSADALTTDAGVVIGSPGFLSPEQISFGGRVDARADIWAAGAILYEALTGRAAFPFHSLENLHAPLLSTPRPPSRWRSEVPAAMDAIVMKCLEKQRTRRFQSAAELARALAPFVPARARIAVERAERIALAASEREGARRPVAPKRRLELVMETSRGAFVNTTIRRARWLLVPAAAIIGAAAAMSAAPPRSASGADVSLVPALAPANARAAAPAPTQLTQAP